MNLKERLQKAWENRSQIAEGLWNEYVSSSEEIKAEATRRLEICKSNICGYYDLEGKPENAVMPGKPSCSICKCNDLLKVNCMKCWCALRDIGQTPLWEELLTADQDNEINIRAYKEQFKNK